MVPWPKWWVKVQYSTMNSSRDFRVSEDSIELNDYNATTKAAMTYLAKLPLDRCRIHLVFQLIHSSVIHNHKLVG
jgi:hypothetical protein